MGIVSAISFFFAGAVTIFGIATFYHAYKWAVKDIEGNFQNVISMIMLGTSMFILATAMLAHGKIHKVDDKVRSQELAIYALCKKVMDDPQEQAACIRLARNQPPPDSGDES